MSKYNLRSCIDYYLSSKAPWSFDEYLLIRNSSKGWWTTPPVDSLSPLITSPYDERNRQHFISGPDEGRFVMDTLNEPEQLSLYENYLVYCTQCGLTPRKSTWNYSSMACNSQNQYRFDIYHPGRIVVRCSVPLVGCASAWLYYAENKGDFGKPFWPILDRPKNPREVYFEIDIFETFRELIFRLYLGTRVSFTGHWGTQQNRPHATTGILISVDDPLELHWFEVEWDGLGKWTWYMDTVKVFSATIPLPDCERIFPYLKLTYMAMEKIDRLLLPSTWIVDFLAFSDVIEIEA